jgi:hypothetical protein
MKNIFKAMLLLIMVLSLTSHSITWAQEAPTLPAKSKKELKAEEERLAFERTDSLLNSLQFVFTVNPGEGPYGVVFVAVDSTYAEVQSEIRNNIGGHITKCEIKKNEKSKTFSVNIRMRGILYSADVFLFIGAWGDGRATVKSSDPLGTFMFDGEVFDYENADFFEGKSHDVR